ncbi:MAG: GNAT family protein [Chitinispirillia bacterium]|jgi:ribosomal-protein-alanine N-acetyltransferase
MIKLESRRLIIRDHINSDLEAMHNWISDPDVMQFLDWKTNSVEETSLKLKEAMEEISFSNRRKYYFAVELKDTKQIVGDTGFTILTKNDYGGIVESGYFFIRQFWGRGFASEALNTLHEFAFNKLGVHKIIASCDAENRASEKVMIKCGMLKEGEFKKHHFRSGKWCNRLKYALLKEEWINSTH